jgi:hypothetical protein
MSVNCQDTLLHMKKYKNYLQRNECTLTNKIKMGKTNTVILWCCVRRNSRVSGLGLMSYPSGFETCDFYSERLSAPRPNPNLEDQVWVFITPGDKVTEIYPQALGSSGLRERHLPYSQQLRDPEGRVILYMRNHSKVKIVVILCASISK